MARNAWNVVLMGTCCLIFTVAGNQCPSGLPKTTTIRPYANKCYQFVYEEKYWPDARDFCWNNGGHLVDLRSSAVNSFITSTLNSLTWTNKGVWIGLNDRNSDGAWRWTAKRGRSERVHNGYSNWDSGHPGAFLSSQRDCIRITRGSGWRWSETVCASLKYHYRFICEYDRIIPTTTVMTTNVAGGVLPWGNSQKPSTDNKRQDTTAVKKTTIITTQQKTSERKTTTQIKTTPTTEKTTVVEKQLPGDEGNMIEPVARAQQSDDENGNGGIIGGVVGCGIGALLILLIIFLILRRRRKEAAEEKEPTVSFGNPTYGAQAAGGMCGAPSPGCMNNAEAHISATSLPGIPRLENLEKAPPNLYSDPAQLGCEGKGASASGSHLPDLPPPYEEDCAKGAAARCVDNVDIDNLKNLKSCNATANNYSAPPKPCNLEKNPNIYVPMDPPEENIYSEPTQGDYLPPQPRGDCPPPAPRGDYPAPNSRGECLPPAPHHTHHQTYLPMDGSRSNSLDLLVCPDSSTSSVSSDGVGYQYDVPGNNVTSHDGFVYDVPKPENIYSEIPERETQENIYEAVDDVRARHQDVSIV